MYGFCKSAPYSVVLTDLQDVWIDAPDEDEVATMARAAGIGDFNAAKCSYLVLLLAHVFDQDNLQMKVLRDTFTMNTMVGDGIEWEFKLVKADANATSVFFRRLSLSQFQNHAYLLLKVQQLESMIRAKDKYTLYLEENYKTINGSELMDKYKRQNDDEAELLCKYNSTHITTQVNALYDLLPQGHGTWSTVTLAVKDTGTWVASAEELEGPDSKAENLAIKKEAAGNSPSKRRVRLGEINRKRPRLGPTTQEVNTETPLSPIKLSPTKGTDVSPRRRRIGMPGKR